MRINRLRFAVRPGMRRSVATAAPIPTRSVSNEEFPPLPPTPEQQRVEHLIAESADRIGRRLGMDRRAFLRSGGGMAASFLALNTVFGRFFDVLEVETVEAAARAQQRGEPFFILDVQTHYVSSSYDPKNEESKRRGAVTNQGLLGLRRMTRDAGQNPRLAADRGTMTDLSWENFIKEVFLDSETAIGLISTPPGPYPEQAVVPPKEMAHIRDEINRITRSRRMLAHGLVTPQLGARDLEFMEMQARTLKVDAWKAYTGAAPKGFDHGWWMNDEKVTYPMLEKARALKIPRICVHKGLPLGPVEDYNHPRDLIKAAKDFPDLQFLVYHAGLRSAAGADRGAATGEIPWTSEFCRTKKGEPALRNIHMELGSTFGQLATRQPEACAHLLGQIVEAFGADHVLWGTDAIWYGTPQWQIEAFRRFQIPDALASKHGYRPLTREVKAQIFGSNAARLFGVDVRAKRSEIPKDYLSKIKMAYLEEGREPSHRWYGWMAG